MYSVGAGPHTHDRIPDAAEHPHLQRPLWRAVSRGVLVSLACVTHRRSGRGNTSCSVWPADFASPGSTIPARCSKCRATARRSQERLCGGQRRKAQKSASVLDGGKRRHFADHGPRKHAGIRRLRDGIRDFEARRSAWWSMSPRRDAGWITRTAGCCCRARPDSNARSRPATASGRPAANADPCRTASPRSPPRDRKSVV